MTKDFDQIKRVKGELILPGDKSISHRSVMFSSLAKGDSIVYNYLDSADVNSTMGCFRAMGCEIIKEKDILRIKGRGLGGLQKPSSNLDAGNSGTTARLISGVLCNQAFETIVIGDESLSKRPMKRVIDPLTQMGAKISATEKNTLPVTFTPSDNMKAITYELPVASAQIKSAVALSAIHLDEETVIIERLSSRNHTENMLGLKVESEGLINKIYVSKRNYPLAGEYFVPSDISSAAFFIVLGLVLPDSEIIIKNVSLNETRTGILQVLQKMGGDIQILREDIKAGEKYGDIIVRSSKLTNIKIDKEIIPNIIDEIPVLSVAGIFAEGNFRIENAEELRVKESDRIASLCTNFRRAGLTVDEFNDGFELSGSLTNDKVIFDSFTDHRIAMAFAVLSLIIKQGGTVEQFECVAISNPLFLDQLGTLIL